MSEPAPFLDFARRLTALIPLSVEQPAVFSEAAFDALARELFALQFDHVAPYRRVGERRRVTPGTIGHWRDIPALPTAAFKEFELTSLPPGARTTVFHSSGTTAQQPSRHWHGAASLALYEASLRPWFARHLLDADAGPDILWIALTPPPAAAPHSSLVHMFDGVQRAFASHAPWFAGAVAADGAWTLRHEDLLARLRESERAQRPVLLLGTAFLFVHLLDELERRATAFGLPAGSRLLETGGYKGRSRTLPKAELHRQLTRCLGIPATHLHCEYGMSELSSQAYDRPADAARPRSLHFPPWARVQILSPETGREVAVGETGLVQVHDLANVWSVAALLTEDLAVRQAEGFELVGRAAQAETRGCSLLAA